MPVPWVEAVAAAKIVTASAAKMVSAWRLVAMTGSRTALSQDSIAAVRACHVRQARRVVGPLTARARCVSPGSAKRLVAMTGSEMGQRPMWTAAAIARLARAEMTWWSP